VIGRNVDRWLGTDKAVRRVRRLQGEAQMLLHTHPLNEDRAERGLLPVNSFWLSGCGLPQAGEAPEPTVDERLRQPALAEDWAAWCKAWDSLDEGPLAQALQSLAQHAPISLTLCGERSAVTLSAAPRGWVQRLRTRLSPPSVPALLERL
jgi:hypothetical protein